MTNYAKNETEDVAESAREAFSYNALTGVVTRIKGNSRSIGGTGYVRKDVWGMEYVLVSLNGTPRMAHRIAWLLHYGSWPTMQIDHRNGNGCDNRIKNLREATGTQNSRNTRKRNPRSGHTGVRWHKQGKCWNARITIEGKEIGLGLFKNKKDAVSARRAAEKKHGFTVRKR